VCVCVCNFRINEIMAKYLFKERVVWFYQKINFQNGSPALLWKSLYEIKSSIFATCFMKGLSQFNYLLSSESAPYKQRTATFNFVPFHQLRKKKYIDLSSYVTSKMKCYPNDRELNAFRDDKPYSCVFDSPRNYSHFYNWTTFNTHYNILTTIKYQGNSFWPVKVITPLPPLSFLPPH
jgi:hypothetical protein